MNRARKITIVVPIYNGESTLEKIFEGLERQSDKHLVEEILLINDKSPDNGIDKVNDYAKRSSFKVRVVDHERNLGLAGTYNEGMQLASTELVVFMHQDIYLQDKGSFAKITAPFAASPKTVAAYPYFVYPYSVWIHDGFWQKVLFSRLVDKKVGKLNGKFDCISKKAGVFFNAERYRTAGEDFDFEVRLKQHGEIAQADLEVSHLQSNDEHFSLKRLIKKEAQLAECYGVNLRRHFAATPLKDVLLILVRPVLLFAAFIPAWNINEMAGLVLLAFCIYYSWRVFTTSYKDIRILALPFVNLLNVAIYSVLLVKGFVMGRQRI